MNEKRPLRYAFTALSHEGGTKIRPLRAPVKALD